MFGRWKRSLRWRTNSAVLIRTRMRWRVAGIIAIAFLAAYWEYDEYQNQISNYPEKHDAAFYGIAFVFFVRDLWRGLHTNSEAFVALFTIILAIVTTLLAFYTSRLWRVTNDLVIGAKETAKTELRAYVFAKDLQLIPDVTSTYSPVPCWRVSVTLGNGGSTPTKNMRHAINFRDFAGDMPDDFDFPDSDRATPSIGLIGPHSEIQSAHVDITTSIVDLVELGARSVYIWGWVDYGNVINAADRHRTEYCFELLKHGNLVSFRPHGRFNNTDEQCIRQPTPYTDGDNSPS